MFSISNTISHNELGWGTDEKALIRILGQRNAAQRKAIRETYLELYNESLIDRIHAELSGDFRVCLLLVTLFTFAKKKYIPICRSHFTFIATQPFYIRNTYPVFFKAQRTQ